jgi:predicted DNA-binding protein (UPF0251 family)
MSERRRRRESPRAVPDRPTPEPPEPTDPAALAALDEEIARLPDRQRAAVVLCELQGVSRREAAARLGLAEGTVSSRLAAARKRLADRLRRRGVAPVGGVAGLLASGANAAGVPPVMVCAAAALGAGASPVSASVSALAHGEIRAMFLTKLMLIATGAAGLLAVAVGLWSAGPAVATPVPPLPVVPARAPVPPPGPPRVGAIVVTSSQPGPPAEVRTPDGAEGPSVALGAAPTVREGAPSFCPLMGPRLSPDGKRLAAFRLGPIPQMNGPWTPFHLWVFDLDAKEGPKEPLLTDVRYPSVVWSADGTKLYGSQVDPEKAAEDIKPPPLVSWVYDLGAKKKTPLALPTGHGIMDLSPDGKVLLTVVHDPFDPPSTRTYLVPLDTLKPRPLTETAFKGMRFSPDGKSVLGNRSDKAGGKPVLVPLAVVSVADGTERQLPVPDGAVWVYHACWAPDGKRVAYHWYEEVSPPAAQLPVKGNPPKRFASRVSVADADGRNPKTIVRREDQEVTGLDWK